MEKKEKVEMKEANRSGKHDDDDCMSQKFQPHPQQQQQQQNRDLERMRARVFFYYGNKNANVRQKLSDAKDKNRESWEGKPFFVVLNIWIKSYWGGARCLNGLPFACI